MFDVLPNGVEGPWLAFLASMRRILAREVRLADVPSIVLRHIEVLVQLEDTLPFSELGGFLHLTLELGTGHGEVADSADQHDVVRRVRIHLLRVVAAVVLHFGGM